MNGNDDILIFKDNEKESIRVTRNADIIFILDFNHLSRLGDYSNIVRESNGYKIMIDHHQDPDLGIADVIISDSNSSSTCQLLFNVIDYLRL